LINFVDATNDANHYTKPPPVGGVVPQVGSVGVLGGCRNITAWKLTIAGAQIIKSATNLVCSVGVPANTTRKKSTSWSR